MLLFSYSHQVCSTQGIQDMVRSLSLLPSATLKTEICVPAGKAADCLEFLAVLKVRQLPLVPLLVFKFLVALLAHPSSLPFTGFLQLKAFFFLLISLSPSAFTYVASLLYIDRDLPLTLLVLSFVARRCK